MEADAASKPPVPTWDQSLIDKFSSNLRTEKEVESAIDELLWWRSNHGLEAMIAYRRRLSVMYIPDETFDMCSSQTYQLGLIYRNSMMDNCCDSRSINFYPLLDRIVSWMEVD